VHGPRAENPNKTASAHFRTVAFTQVHRRRGCGLGELARGGGSASGRLGATASGGTVGTAAVLSEAHNERHGTETKGAVTGPSPTHQWTHGLGMRGLVVGGHMD
jgi:hypothetical protein